MASCRGITSRRRHATLVLFALFAAPQSCLADSILAPAGPVAAGDRIILLDAVFIMLAIVIPTMLATAGFAWWFRASNTRATWRPDWSYSGRIELLVWSVPTLVIFFLGGVIWIGSHRLDPFQPLRPRESRSRSTWSRSTGNGCSSTRSRTWPASIALSFLSARRCIFALHPPRYSTTSLFRSLAARSMR